jgi:CRISPR-associated exonuclease Cas4
MNLLVPVSICNLVNCDDLDNLDAESALAEMRKEQEVFTSIDTWKQ